MSLRGTIRSNHMPVNNFRLVVVGLPPLTPVSIGELESELETVMLPDRTVVSGGNTKPGETDIAIPAHHDIEIFAMELWLRGSKDPVNPAYKLPATVLLNRLAGGIPRTFSLPGLFPKKRVTPALEMDNEGDMAVIVYTLSYDDVVLL